MAEVNIDEMFAKEKKDARKQDEALRALIAEGGATAKKKVAEGIKIEGVPTEAPQTKTKFERDREDMKRRREAAMKEPSKEPTPAERKRIEAHNRTVGKYPPPSSARPEAEKKKKAKK